MVMSDFLGSVGSFAGGLAGMFSDDKAAKRHQENVELWKKLRLPDFDVSQLSPRELQLVGEYMPEVYQFIAPEGVQLAESGPEGRQAQLSAMDYFDRVRQEGLPLADRLAAESATDALSRQTARDAQYAQEALQRRGMGSGGAAMAAGVAAGQNQSDLARQMGQDLSQQAILSRLSAAGQGAQIGGQMRGQDFQEAAQNAQMWNRFNEFVSSGMTQAAADAANARNQAQAFNLGERQRLSDTNIGQKNAYDVRNQEYGNQMGQLAHQNEFNKTAGVSNALLGQAQYQADQRAADMENLVGLGQAAGQGVGGGVDALLAALSGGTGGLNPQAGQQIDYMRKRR